MDVIAKFKTDLDQYDKGVELEGEGDQACRGIEELEIKIKWYVPAKLQKQMPWQLKISCVGSINWYIVRVYKQSLHLSLYVFLKPTVG